MKFYLAGRYDRREELAGYAELLRAAGHEVTSRWLTGEHEARDINPSYHEMTMWARADHENIERADVLIAFTEQQCGNYQRGGRHVELGIAIALAKTIVIIGPVENIFYASAKYRFEDFRAFETKLCSATFFAKICMESTNRQISEMITDGVSGRTAISEECDALKAFLLEKNRAYGNSALEPVRVFSRADSAEQIRVRIDDKLSRLMRGGEFPGDDTVLDLIGYFILLRIATKTGGAS